MRVVFILFALFTFSSFVYAAPDYKDNDIISVQIKGNNFDLLTAKSPAATSRGLGNRALMPKDGMIFLFDKAKWHIFWMKDMFFPIDIVWVSGGKVIGFAENAQPQPNTPDSKLQRYYSPAECETVIELNAGTVKKLNIKTGDIVRIADNQ
jgi:uncharacterized membrane protein (UPF0127 family)